MNTNMGPSGQGSGQGPGQGSAKIYQFPTGGRASVEGQRRDINRLNAEFGPRTSSNVSSSNVSSSNVSWASAGSGWYHEEAILDAQAPKKALQQAAVILPLTFPRH